MFKSFKKSVDKIMKVVKHIFTIQLQLELNNIFVSSNGMNGLFVPDDMASCQRYGICGTTKM